MTHPPSDAPNPNQPGQPSGGNPWQRYPQVRPFPPAMPTAPWQQPFPGASQWQPQVVAHQGVIGVGARFRAAKLLVGLVALVVTGGAAAGVIWATGGMGKNNPTAATNSGASPTASATLSRRGDLDEILTDQCDDIDLSPLGDWAANATLWTVLIDGSTRGTQTRLACSFRLASKMYSTSQLHINTTTYETVEDAQYDMPIKRELATIDEDISGVCEDAFSEYGPSPSAPGDHYSITALVGNKIIIIDVIWVADGESAPKDELKQHTLSLATAYINS